MKLNRIFMALLLSLALTLAGSGCVSQGGEAGEDESVDAVVASEVSNIWANPVTPWNAEPTEPVIDPTSYIHPQASVIGDATIGAHVMVSPFASVRSDEGMPIFVGDECNIQDGAVLHALETIDEEGEPVESHIVEVGGEGYAVYVGERVSIAHQAQIHGPAYVGNDTFVGMKAMVFNATVGNNCVLEPTSAVIGVTVPDGRYVTAGTVVTSQAKADALPEITDDYAYRHTNEAVVYVNVHLAEGYNAM